MKQKVEGNQLRKVVNNHDREKSHDNSLMELNAETAIFTIKISHWLNYGGE